MPPQRRCLVISLACPSHIFWFCFALLSVLSFQAIASTQLHDFFNFRSADHDSNSIANQSIDRRASELKEGSPSVEKYQQRTDEQQR